MCNLSQGVKETAWGEGRNEGWDEGQMELFRNIVASGMSKEEAQRITRIRDDLAEKAMPENPCCKFAGCMIK